MPNNTGPMTKDNMVELKPCPMPWCEALERDGDYPPVVRLHHFGNYRVVCTSCVCEGPLRATEAEAIAAWNTRSAMPSPDRTLVERVAAIIDPDAWHEKLPTDGLGKHWHDRRNRAREKAAAAIAAMPEASDLEGKCADMREALEDARIAIDSLDEDELGRHPELGHFYRDELLAKIKSAQGSSL